MHPVIGIGLPIIQYLVNFLIDFLRICENGVLQIFKCVIEEYAVIHVFEEIKPRLAFTQYCVLQFLLICFFSSFSGGVGLWIHIQNRQIFLTEPVTILTEETQAIVRMDLHANFTFPAFEL